jgi:hypothetical protein
VSARTLRFKPRNLWESSTVVSSLTRFCAATDDPNLYVTTAPTGSLTLNFGGKSEAFFTVDRAAPASAQPAPSASAPPPPPAPAPTPIARAVNHAPRPPAYPSRPEPNARPPVKEQAPEYPNRIEMSIDSLPHHYLIEPIPVAIDPVGDEAFTAWVRNLDTSATGHSVGEALVLLKERIEFVYDDLNGRTQLTPEERTTLQMLHTYITPPSQRPDWVY